MNDNKYLKYKKIYDDINDLYIKNKCRTIDECCKHLNISKNKYYYFCLKYQMQSIFKINKNKLSQNGDFKKFNMNMYNKKYLKVKMVSKTNNTEQFLTNEHNENNNLNINDNKTQINNNNNEKRNNMSVDNYNSKNNYERLNAYTENTNNISTNVNNEQKNGYDIEKLKNIYMYKNKILKNNQQN